MLGDRVRRLDGEAHADLRPRIPVGRLHFYDRARRRDRARLLQHCPDDPQGLGGIGQRLDRARRRRELTALCAPREQRRERGARVFDDLDQGNGRHGDRERAALRLIGGHKGIDCGQRGIEPPFDFLRHAPADFGVEVAQA